MVFCFICYRYFCITQAIGNRLQAGTSGISRVLQHHEALAVKSLALIVLEPLHRNGASVIHSGYKGIAFYLKTDQIVGVRTQIAILIQNLYRYETQVTPIGIQVGTVGSQADLDRSSGCTDFFLAYYLAFFTCHHLHASRLELDTPCRMQAIRSLRLHALRLAVDKKFHLVGIVVIAPHINILSRRPVPVREKMEHRLVRPLRLIEVIGILRKSGKVDDAEIRAACRPSVRSRLADIVESRPHILPADESIVTNQLYGFLMRVSPRHMAIVVCRASESRVVIRLVPTVGTNGNLIARHPVIPIIKGLLGKFLGTSGIFAL